MSSSLPPSLLSRLASDAAAASASLADSSLPDATASCRTSATRRLLALTPRALDTLERLASPTAPEKVQLDAAKEILHRSPATSDSSDSLPSGGSLPAAFISSLASALGSFASAFSAFAPASSSSVLSHDTSSAVDAVSAPASAPDSTFTMEDLVKSEPLALSSLPAPTPAQPTSSGLTRPAVPSSAKAKPHVTVPSSPSSPRPGKGASK